MECSLWCVVSNIEGCRTCEHILIGCLKAFPGALAPILKLQPIAPGLVIPTSRADLEKAGIDVSSIDFYTPRSAQKKSDSVTEPDEDETNSLPDF